MANGREKIFSRATRAQSAPPRAGYTSLSTGRAFRLDSLDRLLKSIGKPEGERGSILTAEDRAALEKSISASVIPELLERVGRGGIVPNEPSPDSGPFDIDSMLLRLLDRDAHAYQLLLAEFERLDFSASEFLEGPVREMAVRLGMMWSDDRLGFYEVTLAVARLQTFVWELVQRKASDVQRVPHPKRILLARVSGEEHTLGLLVVTACFQEEGWEVSGGVDLETGPRMLDKLSRESFAVLGVSASGAVDPGRLRAIVQEARRSSANARIGICVGGPDISLNSENYHQVDADFLARDAVSAIKVAETFAN